MTVKGLKPDVASRNPEQTRKRILDSALREFASHGFAGARVDAIAAHARINKRMLYHYYGNKEELFRAVIRHKMSERAAWMSSAPADPFEALPQWQALMQQDPHWIRLLLWEALQWGGKKKMIDEPRRKKVLEAALDHMREQQRQGNVPPEMDAGQLLLSLLALTAYPFVFANLSRIITGIEVSDPKFVEQRNEFLRQLGVRLKQSKPPYSPPNDHPSGES